jgi:hypothetical protein
LPEAIDQRGSEILGAYYLMNAAEQDGIIALMEAMISKCGIREAAISFLESAGVINPAIMADRILNDADGIA